MVRRDETFHGERSDEHPIRWESAGNPDDFAYLTWDESLRRLVNQGWDAGQARRALERGHAVRTQYAFYRLEA